MWNLDLTLERWKNMKDSTAATIGKITGIVIIFIVFYILMYLGGTTIGLPLILALLAANIVETKILVSQQQERK